MLYFSLFEHILGLGGQNFSEVLADNNRGLQNHSDAREIGCQRPGTGIREET